jgi:two-component system response regulator BaeR
MNQSNQEQIILIVEDEPKLAQILKDYLSRSGFDTRHIANGLEVESWVQNNAPVLVLLDLMLPGKDGIEICKGIRGFSQVPIIMITAQVDELDRLLGLELGADDYICKPFSPREVVARVKAVLRRSLPKNERAVSQGIELDELRFKAIIHGKELILTPVEFQLLSILFNGHGRIYSREQLMDHIYKDNRVVSDRTIDSHIKKLRKRIAEVLPNTEIIHSVYGVGYKFEGVI